MRARVRSRPCRRFGAAGPCWGRQYLFWHGGRPLTLIYEVFSTALQDFLGSIEEQQQQPAAVGAVGEEAAKEAAGMAAAAAAAASS